MVFRRQIDPDERHKVIELLGRWSHAIARIDRAIDTVKLTIAEQPLGMQSEEFEKARLEALGVVDQVHEETTAPEFWPILKDNRGAKILWEFKMKLEESFPHQLNLLNLMGVAGNAFRSGMDSQAPTPKEMKLANKSFARVLDQMGATGGKLTRYYGISAQEYQRELKGSGE